MWKIIRALKASTLYLRKLYENKVNREMIYAAIEEQGFMYYNYKNRTYIPIRPESKRRH